ncbi:insulinase family protein [Candidatus Falkowbacteria bacterium]|nr:insulinase family protein [Candidatus Falkowbacteria bacterium]
MVSKYKFKKYSNGLRLITAPMKGTEAATIFFFFEVGSRYEPDNLTGAAHFIEHMMFKGTKKRPTTLMIAKELDRFGAEFNAMTSKDFTGYYVKINHEKLELGCEILSDMILNSMFDEKELEREKGVIIEEINMYHDNPLMYIEDRVETLIYKGSTLAREVAGEKEMLRQVSRADLLNFKNAYYSPKRTVVVVAGKIPRDIEKLIKKYYLKHFGKKVFNGAGFEKFVPTQKQSRVDLMFKKTNQVQLALGFLGPGYESDKLEAANLLAVILGGNMSSRLFIQVRERRGLAYFVRCAMDPYQDIGAMIVRAGLDRVRIDEALQVILSELKKIKKYGVAAKELKDAKEFLRGKILLSMEDSSDVAGWFGKQALLLKKTMTPDQKIARLMKVRPSEIKKMANEIFDKKLLNLAIIGPYKNKKKFQKIIETA